MEAFLTKIIMQNNIIHLKVLLLLKIYILWSVNTIIYFGSVHNDKIQAMLVFSHKVNWKIANSG